ncbi:54S ribosomal protein L12, mitochondrial [Anopheles stephensi]|uniref:39S ribosomal protein L12, mitochondrial n=1 Tax=Anopheles stephensi TaxID=30069 RepID=A0A182Y618_ANOST|nr:54S ribosomal protein L12, mitochondrial [Anopheles stephensi]
MIALRTVGQLSRVTSLTRHITTNTVRHAEAAVASAGSAKLTIPVPEGTEKPADPKLVSIVDSIAQLNLLEVSELSTLLKRKLNLPDTAMMPAGFGAFAAGAGGAAPAAADEEEAAPKVVKTTFKVKLVKFDEKQKVALIKEVKNLLEGMNLVQAKKFVESAPTVVKEDIPKDEAEKLKEAFTKVGAVIEIE